LVIFVIRTQGAAWASRAHPVLTASSLAALGAAFAIVVSPIGAAFGFAAVPAAVLLAMAALVAICLAAAEGVPSATPCAGPPEARPDRGQP